MKNHGGRSIKLKAGENEVEIVGAGDIDQAMETLRTLQTEASAKESLSPEPSASNARDLARLLIRRLMTSYADVLASARKEGDIYSSLRFPIERCWFEFKNLLGREDFQMAAQFYQELLGNLGEGRPENLGFDAAEPRYKADD